MRRLAIVALLLVAGSVRQSVNAGQLTLVWDDNSLTETGLEIERLSSEVGVFDLVATIGPDQTAYTDSTALEGTFYCYRLRAFNAAGYSKYSNEACGTARAGRENISLGIAPWPAVVRPGDAFGVEFTLMNSGTEWPVDAYFGVMLPPEAASSVACPTGTAVAFWADRFTRTVLACRGDSRQEFAPLVRDVAVRVGVTSVSVVLGTAWPEDLPAGEYSFFGMLSALGAFLDGHVDPGDVISFDEARVISRP
jgi:hypothetical protein